MSDGGAPEIDPEALTLALDHAVSAREEQSKRLESFRSRSVSLLGAVTIGGSFLAIVGDATASGINPWFGLLAAAAFVVQFGCTFHVLYPVRDFTFSFDPAWLKRKALDEGLSVDALRAKLLRGVSKGTISNDTIIDKVSRSYSWAQLAFLGAVMASVLAVAIGD